MSEQNVAPNQEPVEGRESASSLLYPETPAETPAEPKEPEAPETPPAEGSEPEIPPAKGGEEGQQDPPEKGDEGETIATLPELLESNEWDPEWFDGLKVPVKVDGEAAEATMKDLVAGYQMNLAAEKRLDEAKTKSKTANEEIARRESELSGHIAIASELIGRAEQALETDVGAIDWNALKEDDPAKFSALKVEMQERKEEIQNIKGEAVTKIQEAAKQREGELRENHQQFVANENVKLLDALPEWRDSDKAKAEKAKLAEYLTGQGFAQEDVMAASDHRLILMARKAMLYDAMQLESNALAKKVVKTPKVLKPGVKAESKPKPASEKSTEELFYGTG